ISTFLFLLSLGCSKPTTPASGKKSPVVENPRLNLASNSALALLMAQACTPNKEGPPVQSTCPAGELCVKKAGSPSDAVCMIDCSDRVDDHLVKNHDKCPPSWRCATKKTSDLRFVGNFCIKPQPARDLVCEAPFDVDACLDSMSC